MEQKLAIAALYSPGLPQSLYCTSCSILVKNLQPHQLQLDLQGFVFSIAELSDHAEHKRSIDMLENCPD